MMAILVTLDMFSGRPNPEWTLGPAEAAVFERRISALPSISASNQPDAPLGYRGFTIREDGNEVRVFGGQVTTKGQVLADRGRSLERWLLDSGRGSLDPGTASYVESQTRSGH
jgi:hypothetical protein